MDITVYEIIGFAIGALLVALIAYLKYKNMDAKDGMAMIVVKNGRLLVEKFSDELKAYDENLYKNVNDALNQCEDLLVDEDLSMNDCIKAILVFGPVFVDAAKKIGVHYEV